MGPLPNHIAAALDVILRHLTGAEEYDADHIRGALETLADYSGSKVPVGFDADFLITRWPVLRRILETHGTGVLQSFRADVRKWEELAVAVAGQDSPPSAHGGPHGT